MKSNETAIPLIRRLLVDGGPGAICRRVGLIVLFTVDAILTCGAWPHVGKKLLERFKPFVANGNTSRSISRITSMLRVVAALFNRHPRPVLNGSLAALRRTMLRAHRLTVGFHHAAARAYLPTPQKLRQGLIADSAACAVAYRKGFRASIARLLDIARNCQEAVFCFGQRFMFSTHTGQYNTGRLVAQGGL